MASVAGRDERDVSVEVGAEHTAGDLERSLRRFLDEGGDEEWRLHVERLGTAPDRRSRVLDVLRTGDRVTLTPPGWRPSPGRQEGRPLVLLSVVGGPAAGSTFELPAGTHSLGREAPSAVVVDDPGLSRLHFELTVDADRLVVRDTGSTNGTFIDGAPVATSTTVGFGTVLEAGNSLVRLDPPAGRARERSSEAGVVRFNRPPRVTFGPEERTFAAPAPPTAPEKGRIPLVGALAPLVLAVPLLAIGVGGGGGSMVAIGVATALLSALIAVGSVVEDRRTGARRYRRDVARYHRQIDELVSELRRAVVEEAARRRTAAPPAPDLIRRAREVAPELWERRPGDPDFLTLSAGWADQPSLIEVQVPASGDEQLGEDTRRRLAAVATAPNVPVQVCLPREGSIGLYGDPDAVDGSARWLLTQVATLHSPRDVVVAAAFTHEERARWSWLAWLPHARSDGSPLEHPHLATGEEEAVALFDAITALVRSRSGDGSPDRGASVPTPRLVLLVSGALRVPRAALTPILEQGPPAGVHVVWAGTQRTDLPGECGATIGCARRPPICDVSFPARGEETTGAAADRLDLRLAHRVALALAPVRDVAAAEGGEIPRSSDLLPMLGLERPTAEAVRARWSQSGDGLAAPLGAGARGPWQFDIRADGPHALVGGTTGSGKSELLQTLVASLAATHPPSRVTFLLVDYKGGAAFKDAVHLPHTVGFVTDLDGHLVHRALESLHAELRRREEVLREHGAKDLLELERRLPSEAPPALILVVDEFATLAKELPDFVDGVVNVAQRGRSLGIHLILATQRPAGAINDNIRANTNLRIALRMNDVADSQDVIDSRDAALLPRSLPGRAFVRTGQSELHEVQVAYVGGAHEPGASQARAELEVAPLEMGRVQRRSPNTAADPDGPTDLQVLVEAVRQAAEEAGIPPPRRPWIPPLPAVLPLSSVTGAAAAPGRALMGLADRPSEQAQAPHWFDLEADGNLVVFGGGGAGKTTALRSLAVSLATSHDAGELHIYVLDFATRGLAGLAALPHVGAIVPGTDVERVQRLLTMLEEELAARREAFAGTGASTLSEHARIAGAAPPRIVVLLDGLPAFNALFDAVDFGQWIERLHRLASEGRALGLHWLLTTDRRTAVYGALSSAVGARLVLRMPDDDDYAALGLDPKDARSALRSPGRGFAGTGLELQVPIVGPDPASDAQNAAIEQLAAGLPVPGPGRGPRPVLSLPDEVRSDALPVAHRLSAAVGLRHDDLRPHCVSVADGNLLVAGPVRSGRSTTLVTIVRGLKASTPEAVFHLIAPRKSPLTSLGLWASTASTASECDDLAARLDDDVAARDGSEPPVVIVVDDAGELEDTDADISLERIARRGRDVGVHVVASAEITQARRSYSGILAQLRKDRSGLLLQPDPDLDGELLGALIPRSNSLRWVEGRGAAVDRGKVAIVQVAVTGEQ